MKDTDDTHIHVYLPPENNQGSPMIGKAELEQPAPAANQNETSEFNEIRGEAEDDDFTTSSLYSGCPRGKEITDPSECRRAAYSLGYNFDFTRRDDLRRDCLLDELGKAYFNTVGSFRPDGRTQAICIGSGDTGGGGDSSEETEIIRKSRNGKTSRPNRTNNNRNCGPGGYQIVGTQIPRDQWQDCGGIRNEVTTQGECKEAAGYLRLPLGFAAKDHSFFGFYFKHPCQTYCFVYQNVVYFSTNTAPEYPREYTCAKICRC